VLAGAGRRVAVGLILGVPMAIIAGKLISSQLYGVAFYDPPALGAAIVALSIATFFAAIIPAARAASIHPMTALRTE
jgi:ABC-type antimicrobial peptide transport system permease subunit